MSEERYAFSPDPPPEVMEYFEKKGLKPSFNWRDVWAEEHAIAFTVAKSTGFDILEDIHEELTAALREGLPFREFRKRLEPRLKAKGWWGRKELVDPKTGEIIEARLGSRRRLKVIYEANVRTARAAGQWERAQRTKRMLPYFEYRLGPSERHRQKHVSWAMRPTILPVDDPFWDTHFPPNGWGCKCWLRQISRREAERRGGPTAPPPITWREYKNPRDGRTYRIPDGIDPGWHTNPGKARWRMRAALQRLAERAATLPPELTLPAIRQIVRSQQFRKLARGELPKEVILPVALVPSWLRKEMEADTSIVLLSAETAQKQIRVHPNEFSTDKGAKPEEIYSIVQKMIEEYDIVLEEDAYHYAIHKLFDGKWWRLIIKVTRDGREIYLQSLHRDDKAPKKVKRANRILRKKAPGGS